ncbi:MAG: hypothetical protein LBI80_05355 [Endomicrobium sp.]|jgi:hypothetical protein|nr:hypothetical protein [Endomicrobium sp.]
MKKIMMLVSMFIMMCNVNSYAGKGFFARWFCCCCGDDDVVDIDVVDERSPLLNSDVRTQDFGSFKQHTTTDTSYEINPLHSGPSTIEQKTISSVASSEPIPSRSSISTIEPSPIPTAGLSPSPAVESAPEPSPTPPVIDSKPIISHVPLVDVVAPTPVVANTLAVTPVAKIATTHRMDSPSHVESAKKPKKPKQ